MILELIFAAALAQDAAAVSGAIDRGIRTLKNDPVDVNPDVKPTKGGAGTNELKLLTFIHAGVAESDPVFVELLTRSIAVELRKTYNVSLLAVALEELDRVKHQEKIWQCAQFLVDNMAPNGEWGYGQPTTYAMPATTPSAARKPTATARPKPGAKAKGPVERVKPVVTRQIPVKKQRDGTDPHDNSNTQYAALGLRSAHDSGILLPREVVDRAMKWWLETQLGSRADPKGVATEGGTAAPAGWNYDGGRAYGSMTVGGVGSLAIYRYILGESWVKDPAVRSGVEWIVQNFSVTENPGKGNSWYYYYLYGMERAGVLYGTETFGAHAWYAEGARELLKLQRPDGSWGDSPESTCFAILFLRRATAPLVASVDRVSK